MDRRDGMSLWRDYGVPMQDKNAFSLQYRKDTSKDPSKFDKTKKKKPANDWLKDKTGLLKVREAAPEKSKGGLLPITPCKVCGKDTCPGCGDKMRLESSAPANIKPRYKVSDKKAQEVIDNVPKKFLFMMGDKKVFAVDDNYVKVNLYADWVEGGNEEAYPEFTPEGEIWVDGEKSLESQKAIALHEYTEEQHMEKDGMTYEKAHPLANKEEMKYRKNMKPLQTPMGLYKKGGKIGDPKDRDKAGGSNAGKYSKSEGPFAGPSGGAPKGSYPIGSKSRGKSALKLAHNAPNPSGIKATVYRKYPDLKTKKAMEGAKLELGGMGQMQGKAPIPTKYSAPPDKVKQNFALYKRKRKEPKAAFGH